MPKGKKGKIVSLVSAYESGAESDNENQTDTDSESSNESSPRSISRSESDSGSRSGSRESDKRSITKSRSRSNSKSDNEQDLITESGKKRLRDQLEQEIGEDLQTKIFEREDSNEEFRKKSKRDNLDIENSLSNEQADKINEDLLIEQNDNSTKQSGSLYTIENGFLPGCENIKIPPAPNTECSESLKKKIVQVLDRMKLYNYSFNNHIKNRKEFKNPSIYEKLIDSYGIDEFGSSFESHIENLKSSGYMFYDELDQAQMAEWAKKEKERKERTKIEMVSGTKKK